MTATVSGEWPRRPVPMRSRRPGTRSWGGSGSVTGISSRTRRPCRSRRALSIEREGNMGHVVLLGDSIFDNAAYVGGRPAVIDQVRAGLPDGWHATLNA